MLLNWKASEVAQFVVGLAIAIVVDTTAVWGILTNIGSQDDSTATLIESISVPAAHP